MSIREIMAVVGLGIFAVPGIFIVVLNFYGFVLMPTLHFLKTKRPIESNVSGLFFVGSLILGIPLYFVFKLSGPDIIKYFLISFILLDLGGFAFMGIVFGLLLKNKT